MAEFQISAVTSRILPWPIRTNDVFNLVVNWFHWRYDVTQIDFIFFWLISIFIPIAHWTFFTTDQGRHSTTTWTRRTRRTRKTRLAWWTLKKIANIVLSRDHRLQLKVHVGPNPKKWEFSHKHLIYIFIK